MRQLIAIIQLTLDGVMLAPGGPQEDPPDGFTHGGWAMSFGYEVLRQVIAETIAGDFEMLLGRRTYEIFAAYRTHHDDDPIGKAFKTATKLSPRAARPSSTGSIRNISIRWTGETGRTQTKKAPETGPFQWIS